MKIILNKIKSFFYFITQVVIRFLADAGPQRASGLAYATLMATVPLLAVLIGFGGPVMTDEKVHEFLAQSLLPAMQEPIMSAILDFAENSTRLGVLGIPVFLITVILLLNNIEVTLNHIFRVSADRDIWRRITTYTAVIIFAGLFLGSSITLSGDMMNLVFNKLGFTWVYPIFRTRVASFLFIFLGQFILLTFLPGRRVRPSSSFTAAFTGAILWEITKQVFAYWVNQSVRMSVIYGSLFIIPLLLVWIMVVWIILLLMAELTYVHQHRKFYSSERKKGLPGDALLDSLRLYKLIAEDYINSREAPDIRSLSESMDLPERDSERLLAPLMDHQLIHKVSLGKRKKAFVPGRTLAQQDLHSILQVLCKEDPANENTDDTFLLRLEEELDTVLKNLSMDKLIKQTDE